MKIEHNEKESALISIVSILKTNDPDEVIQGAIKSVLTTFRKRVYAAAIKDAKGVMPEEDMSKPVADAPLNDYVRASWNSYRAEALNRLDGLLK